MSKAKSLKGKSQKSKSQKSKSPKAKKPTVKSAAKKIKKPALKAKPKKAAKKTAPKKTAPKAAKSVAPKKTTTSKSAVQQSIAKDVAKLFSPLDDRILVAQTSEANRTPGGLYIPDTVSSEERPRQGLVVAVGPGHRDKKGRLRPLDVKIGDHVMFAAFTGSEIKIENQELICLREDEVIAVMG